MQSWTMASRRCSVRCSAPAFILPAATSSATRLGRTATRANSEATKKPLAATSKNTEIKPTVSDMTAPFVDFEPATADHAPAIA